MKMESSKFMVHEGYTQKGEETYDGVYFFYYADPDVGIWR